MDKEGILQRIEHTILKPEATWKQVQVICEEAVRCDTAMVCISPVFVPAAAAFLEGRKPICTVVGFPLGTSAPESKAQEARLAVHQGAEEVDMVVSLGLVKAGCWQQVKEELCTVKEACEGKVLKVIVEACLLTEEEKLRLCDMVSTCGADYIKTSTGFSTGGATVADVALFRGRIAPHVKIKAAGGIRTWEFAQQLVDAGADRLGSSALVPLYEQGIAQN